MSQIASSPVIAEPSEVAQRADGEREEHRGDADEQGGDELGAISTRPRHGTSVYVVRPVRWLYSPVTDRIAMIGSTTDSGMPIARGEGVLVIASSGAQMITAAVASTDDDADARHQPEAGAGVEHLAELDLDEPARRDGAYDAGGRRGGLGRRDGVRVAAVLMLLLLHGRCRR